MKIPYRIMGALLAAATVAVLTAGPAAAGASSWKVYNYNPSGQAWRRSHHRQFRVTKSRLTSAPALTRRCWPPGTTL